MSILLPTIAASRRRFDPDAADYFSRIVLAGSTISGTNKAAVDTFVKGCKADGIWNAIKASCLLAGPDDLTGALVPLVGAAPTNNNFASGDYNRTTGLVGNGSTKYLNSNRSNNSDPQNNVHVATYLSSIGASGNVALGIIFAANGDVSLGPSGATRLRSGSTSGTRVNVGFLGSERSSSSSYNRRYNGTTSNIVSSSTLPGSQNNFIFAANGSSGAWLHTESRISFYSIGESLDLSLLESRLATYMASIV